MSCNYRHITCLLLPPYAGTRSMCIPSMVVAICIGALMALVGIITFIAGVVMLVRAKRALRHSSLPPPSVTNPYVTVDDRVKRARFAAGLYDMAYKQDTQTDGHTKHYQELDLAKMESKEYASIKIKL